MHRSASTKNSGVERRRSESASQDAALLLLFGQLRTGQVKLRKIDGW
jgi:hypothetical protein